MNHIFVTFTQDNFPSVNPSEKTGASMEKYLLPRQFTFYHAKARMGSGPRAAACGGRQFVV